MIRQALPRPIADLLTPAGARAAISSRTAKAKDSRVLDAALRHNPALKRPVATLATRYDASPDTGRAQIRSQLRQRSLEWAGATPYGREIGPADPSDLMAWPILEKESLRRDPAAFERVRRLPAIPAATGGTTGTPLRLLRSLTSLNAEQYFLDRMLTPHRISFARSRIALLRGENVKDPSDTEPPFGRLGQNGRLLVLSSQHLDRTTVGWYVDELASFGADFLWAYPSVLSSLVRLVVAEGLSLRIPKIVTSSEMLLPNERELAKTTLGADIVDYYGQGERVALATDSGGDGYRFEPLYGTVELDPTSADDVPAYAGPTDDAGGAGSGGPLAAAEIIGTGHWNSAMPLVRYRVGDAILYRPDGSDDQLDRIAIGDEAFVGLRGRNSDYLVSPEGGTLVGIDHLPRGLDGVVRMQVRQPARDRVRILVVTAGPFTEADRATLDTTIALKIPSTMQVEVEHVDDLPRTDSGKTPFVVRAPEVDEPPL